MAPCAHRGTSTLAGSGNKTRLAEFGGLHGYLSLEAEAWITSVTANVFAKIPDTLCLPVYLKSCASAPQRQCFEWRRSAYCKCHYIRT